MRQPYALVHLDESCLGNGREGENPGGAGGLIEVRVKGAIERRDVFLSAPASTNNRMALAGATAVLDVLAGKGRRFQVTLVSDSQYLVRGITEWVPGWKARGWRRQVALVGGSVRLCSVCADETRVLQHLTGRDRRVRRPADAGRGAILVDDVLTEHWSRRSGARLRNDRGGDDCAVENRTSVRAGPRGVRVVAGGAACRACAAVVIRQGNGGDGGNGSTTGKRRNGGARRDGSPAFGRRLGSSAPGARKHSLDPIECLRASGRARSRPQRGPVPPRCLRFSVVNRFLRPPPLPSRATSRVAPRLLPIPRGRRYAIQPTFAS